MKLQKIPEPATLVWQRMQEVWGAGWLLWFGKGFSLSGPLSPGSLKLLFEILI